MSERCGRALATTTEPPGCSQVSPLRHWWNPLFPPPPPRAPLIPNFFGAGAQKIVKDFKGKVPSDTKSLQKEIPGIGPYTSAAITSIVYNAPVAAVDGNLQRVYCRVFGIHANLASKATSDALQGLADRTMPRDRPGDYNQAVMDLGYSVCTPKNPACEECPLSERCVAYAQQRLAAGAKPVVPDIEEAALGECSLCAPLPNASPAEVTRYPMAKVKKQSKEDDCAVCVLGGHVSFVLSGVGRITDET